LGLAELYVASGCEGIYRQLLHEDYLSLQLSPEEEARFTSNIDCQFMVYLLGEKNGKPDWSALELLMVLLALLRYPMEKS